MFLLVRSVLVNGLFLMMLRVGIEARAATLGLIYNKLSRLKSVGSKSVGEVSKNFSPLDQLIVTNQPGG